MWSVHKMISHKISPVPSLDLLLTAGFLKIILSLIRGIIMLRTLQLITTTIGVWVPAVHQALDWVLDGDSTAESTPEPCESGAINMHWFCALLFPSWGNGDTEMKGGSQVYTVIKIAQLGLMKHVVPILYFYIKCSNVQEGNLRVSKKGKEKHQEHIPDINHCMLCKG